MNSVGSTVPHFAAEGGNVEVVKELTGRGCDWNVVSTKNGCFPLHYAGDRGRTCLASH